MSELINKFLDRCREKFLTIHCYGDAMVDEYYPVKVHRISPEFPMPIMKSDSPEPIVRPGGAANVIYQLRHFNAYGLIVSFSDPYAATVFSKNQLNQVSILLAAQLPIKRRFLDGSIQVVRHDIEADNCGLGHDALVSVPSEVGRLKNMINLRSDVAILSDYNKGFFYNHSNSIFDHIEAKKTIVDPKRGPIEKWKGCTIFKPNALEAKELSGLSDWESQAKFFQKKLGCESVVITHGGGNVAGIYKKSLFCYKPDRAVNAESVIGAGDCFCAFFALAVAHGFTTPEAAEIAWNAGATYVQNKMNRPITPAELPPGRIVNPLDLAKRDYKLVFTNGCFDILHEGHMKIIQFAKSKGEKLVVALNSDASIKRIKDSSRPVVLLDQRMKIMSHLREVDFVVSFEEDTPEEIIKKIKPDVLVKGSEYAENEIIGAEHVKEVYRAPMIEGVSTSSILAGYLEQQQS